MGITTALSTVADVLANVDKIKAFVQTAVQLAQQAYVAGSQKLAAVLAAAQAFVQSLVSVAQVAADAWAQIKDEIAAFVNGIVALWNSLNVFGFGQPATQVAAAA